MSDEHKERVCSGRIRCWSCGDLFAVAAKAGPGTLTIAGHEITDFMPFISYINCRSCAANIACIVDPTTYSVRRAHAEEIA
jgi:hypothetical protein